MNELHEAYKVLELPPGSDMAAVKRKYRLLSTVWHPDRMASEDFRKQADDKLKTINHARDVLKKHFETSHQETNCECQEQDPELYRQKEQEAKERFHKEQEERRRATQAEERQTKARDEARRKKREEAEEQRQAEAKAAASQEQASSEQIDAAFEQGKRLEAHETYLKFTKISLCAFIATGVILSINLGLANMRADSLKDYKPWEYDQYYELSDKYSKDKSDYLEKHISKKLRSYASELHPPFDQTFRNLQQRFFNPPAPKPKPRPVVKEPQPTQQDKWDIGALEGHYSTRASVFATQEVLKDMLKNLKNAMDKDPSDQVFTRLEQIYNDTYRLYSASQKRIEFLDKSIEEKENRIVSRLGRKYLPSRHKTVKARPFVISTQAAYNNARNSYPELFR